MWPSTIEDKSYKFHWSIALALDQFHSAETCLWVCMSPEAFKKELGARFRICYEHYVCTNPYVPRSVRILLWMKMMWNKIPPITTDFNGIAWCLMEDIVETIKLLLFTLRLQLGLIVIPKIKIVGASNVARSFQQLRMRMSIQFTRIGLEEIESHQFIWNVIHMISNFNRFA